MAVFEFRLRPSSPPPPPPPHLRVYQYIPPLDERCTQSEECSVYSRIIRKKLDAALLCTGIILVIWATELDTDPLSYDPCTPSWQLRFYLSKKSSLKICGSNWVNTVILSKSLTNWWWIWLLHDGQPPTNSGFCNIQNTQKWLKRLRFSGKVSGYLTLNWLKTKY